jgi:peptide/nickel transport system permease protein
MQSRRERRWIGQQGNGFWQIGMGITLFLVALMLLAIVWTPYDVTQMQGSEKLMAPSLQHLFGTDQFGRDVFSRVLVGAKVTWMIGLGAVAIAGVFGTLLGAITGYFGGWLDEILMRLNDVCAAFPSILLALVMVSIWGSGTYRVMLALGISFIPSFARMIRGEVLRIREEEYVQSAKLQQVPAMRILFVHILPNLFPTLCSTLTVGFNNAVIQEVGFSYLGIGVLPPDASIGRMLSESQTYLGSAPWCAIFPGVFLILLVLGVSLLGEGFLASKGGAAVC